MFKVQLSALRQRLFADDVPVELHRLANHVGQLPNHQVQSHDAAGLCLFGVAQRNLSQTLGNG